MLILANMGNTPQGQRGSRYSDGHAGDTTRDVELDMVVNGADG
jgi:hypothetical protein